MRERNKLGMNRFSPSHADGGPSTELDQAGFASGHPEAVPSMPARVGRRDRQKAPTAARLVGALLIAIATLAAPATSSARVSFGVAVSFGPPALPIYAQPLCPGPGYIWTPGYWAWDPDNGYFWVPGTWVLAPFEGALWTPGYWAFDDGDYVWYGGYWGPVVGYYGGIDYGFGYTGYGYYGGYWNRGAFYYNRSVNNIRTTNITTVYNRTVVNNVNVARVSYNGGPGGTRAQATATQLAAADQRRSGPVEAQTRQIQAARNDPAQRAAENKGRPLVAATTRPGEFSGHNAVRASRAGAPYKPTPMRAPRGRTVEHPNAAPYPGRAEASPRVNAPASGRVEPRVRMERTAPERREPRPWPTYRREPPPQTRQVPNMQRQPVGRQSMERRPAPRAEAPRQGGRPQFYPPSPRRGGNPHKPDNPHWHV